MLDMAILKFCFKSMQSYKIFKFLKKETQFQLIIISLNG